MPKKGILLVNLGTPDGPGRGAVYKYLKQFLLDKRVIDYPWILRNLLVRGIIAPLRSGSSSKLYKELWTPEGSPLKVFGERVATGVQQRLGDDYLVHLAMRYQSPSIESAIEKCLKNGASEIVVFPLFPQYASATTGSVFEEVMRIVSRMESIPALSLKQAYYNNPRYIDIIAKKAGNFSLSKYNHFVFSFHGVPQRHLRRADRCNHCLQTEECCFEISEKNQFCYSAQCHATAFAVAKSLGLNSDQCTVCFQSRLGPEKWTRPYTSNVLSALLKEGKKRLLVFSPAFVADCLETTIEIGLEYKEEFLSSGGEALDLVPSLNDDEDWVDLIADLTR